MKRLYILTCCLIAAVAVMLMAALGLSGCGENNDVNEESITQAPVYVTATPTMLPVMSATPTPTPSCTPTPYCTPTATFTPTPTEIPDKLQTSSVTGIVTADTLNVRKNAGLYEGNTVIGSLKQNMSVYIYGYQRVDDGGIWANVGYLDGNGSVVVGYCNVAYIKVDESKGSIQVPTPTITPTPTVRPIPTEIPEDMYRFTQDVYTSKISVNNSDYVIPEATLNNLNKIIDSYDYKSSFYLVDLETRATFAYNAEYPFRSGSVVKCPYMLWAYKQVDAGLIDLSAEHRYNKATQYHVGSGSIRYDADGTIYTTEYLFHNIIQISDNIAYHMTVDAYGTEGYNAMLDELGCTSAGKTTKASMWPSFTTRDLALVWDEIYRFKDICDAGAMYWEDLLKWKCSFVRDAFPYRTIASKSGWYDKGYNDSAIVLNEHPYIIVVMTDSPGHATDQTYCDKLTKALDSMMKEYQESIHE